MNIIQIFIAVLIMLVVSQSIYSLISRYQKKELITMISTTLISVIGMVLIIRPFSWGSVMFGLIIGFTVCGIRAMIRSIFNK